MYVISETVNKDFDIELFRPILESKSIEEFGYCYNTQTKREEKRLVEMFGERYNDYYGIQIFVLEDGGHRIIP
jgi:hypothetical protein